ncbi:MAG: helix-turn-helix domain-containing protein [Hyphomonadaceae bacterium]|nr:helix-turn-helix domain-containing protein [Hyphomonadaceae bacterium]
MTFSGADIWELILRGIAIGAILAVGAGLWRGGAGRSVRIAGLMFSLSTAAYALNSSALVRELIYGHWFFWVVHFLSLGGVGYFWLFVIALFEDRPLTPALFGPAAVLTGVGLVGWLVYAGPGHPIWIGHNVVEACLCAHALFVVFRSWRGDLVEERRRLRGPFLGSVLFYAIVLSGFEIAEGFGLDASRLGLVAGFSLAVACLAGAWVTLDARSTLFGAVQPAAGPAADGLDAGDRLLLTRLNEVMDGQEAWRREGLTIGALAAELNTPEHRLRRLINDHLGARNFAAFVNARRIGAAKRLLADPANARKPVSAIAFDLGFGSLGPFNRAFKDETGVTPSEWRRNQLESGSPIPE